MSRALQRHILIATMASIVGLAGLMAGWVRVVHAQLPSEWVLCAYENQTCAFTGTREVRYGADGLYAYHTATDGYPCTNAVFGDPAPNVAKHCDAREIPVTPPPDPAQVGSWSALQAWPDAAVHAALLPTGSVMFYPYSDDSYLWDPSTSAFSATTKVGYNIFCSGLTLLANGRLFLAGGHISNNVGLDDVSIYDPVTRTWSRQPDMNAGRWYPTTTTLADGSVLVVSGDIDNTVGVNRLPQVWTDGNWRDLIDSQIQLELYPMMLLAPDGRVFNAGPEQTARYLDTSGTGTWTDSASSTGGFRSYGTAVMYEPGKVLIAGGADPPVASAEKIDLNSSSPQWQPAGAMNMPRRQLNATILPDGAVLVTGGSSAPGFDNAAGGVLGAELWDPSDNSFTQLAKAPRYRGYHSVALLLPDGRVLSAGGDANARNAEIFSPPYLFKGPRPAVTAAPSDITYGQSFAVETPDAASISAVTLVRLSAVTHSFNMNQRFVRLGFSAGADRLTVTPPSLGEIAPPGHYMLFLLNGAGVPSVASIVRLSTDLVPSPPQPPSAPTTLIGALKSGQIALTWIDTSNNETGFAIYRSIDDGKSYHQLATVAQDVSTYVDTSPGTSKFVSYRVRAFNTVGNSAFSNTVKVRNR